MTLNFRAALVATLAGAPFLTAGAARAQETARDIAARATPAVVTIHALAGGDEVASGSGFLIRSDGTVVSNFHVVRDADALQVELASGERFDAVYVLAHDARRDVVLLRLAATQLPALDIGDASALATGDPVFVVGNPLGMEGTFSDGLVSARRVIDGVSYIQITAPVSPGSSGGPVLNRAGEVVGITTATVSEGQNLNLAVPIGYAAGLLSVAGSPEPFADAVRRWRAAPAGTAIAGADRSAGDRTAAASAGATESTGSAADSAYDLDDLQPWERVVVEQLIAVGDQLQNEGFLAADANHFAAIAADSTDIVSLSLPAADYRAVVVCDNDCSDVDLQVANRDGTVLASDILEDDIPVVEFTAATPASFQFRVRMVACSTNDCFYGLQVYRRK